MTDQELGELTHRIRQAALRFNEQPIDENAKRLIPLVVEASRAGYRVLLSKRGTCVNLRLKEIVREEKTR